MQQKGNKVFKNLEQLQYYVSNDNFLEVIKSFLKFKATTLQFLDEIEQSIVNATVNCTPKEMIGLYDDYGTLDIIDWIQTITINEENQILKEINQGKQGKQDIQKLRNSYETTFKKSLSDLQSLMKSTWESINNQKEYQTDLTIKRLLKRDESIVLENNGVLFDAGLIAVCVFEPKSNGLFLKGLHQPIFFDGIYFEQPINSKETPHKIRFSLHKGFNLRESLYEEEFSIYDPEFQKVDGNNYLIEFKQKIKLEKGSKYCLCACAGQDDFFGTTQYMEIEQDNAYIKFQEKSYDQGEFIAPDHVFQIISEHDKGIFSALIVIEE
ncbi:unnamed protein product (macronuclear) [Paramecium tetraurelia]|uniref:Uncharacterized protein n=1 Tax=Paramecium tetraurelia TaxID=5888 RepID=A0BEL3_PARTE|nr:uncharacterized protein GSPATT00028013001 [Paramecium tetraurelia]CAK56980.1 unnamed protein product [Paramecium tetraurelia]|eukprot:XP_001424378.1 hypothetical protein (macronuclear) [Paramecium tetraurelia strain d4-2]